MLPELEQRRHAHTALLSMVVASSMGGAQNVKLHDFLLPYAQVEVKTQYVFAGEYEDDFKLALRLSLVAQSVLDYALVS